MGERPEPTGNNFSQKSRTSFAGFGNRLTAFFLDLLILAMTLGIISLLMVKLCLLFLISSNNLILTLIIFISSIIAAPLLFSPAYFFIFHSTGGKTPGKFIMGIKVVNLEEKVINPGISFLRVVGYFLSGIPLAAGFLWVLLDREKKAWHDRLAGTKVIFSEDASDYQAVRY